MSDNRRSAEDEEPQEEFVNDGSGEKENEENNGSNKLKLEEWPLQELQQKAQEENIDDYEKLDRKELIEKIQQRR
ncbi:hypothetical protein [Fodinibius sp.]|uniref:hypothetical protein n=1 Tax=Fodinibius sp. TaxID=1872440 RepID=UPI003567943A